MMAKDIYDKYINYAIIGITSFIALVFLPFVGSEAGLQVVLPETAAGWIVFVFTKTIVAGINVLIFHCFVQQAEVRVKEDARYKEACMLLDEQRHDDVVYLSPKDFYHREYSKKGATIAITSITSAFGLAQAVLTWDALTFLTYLFTILMGIVFGVLEMAKVESYLTNDLLMYARKTSREAEKSRDRRVCNNDTLLVGVDCKRGMEEKNERN